MIKAKCQTKVLESCAEHVYLRLGTATHVVHGTAILSGGKKIP